MCAVILRVSYLANAEPSVLIPFDDEESANARIDELKRLDTVASITVFNRAEKHQRATVWEKAA